MIRQRSPRTLRTRLVALAAFALVAVFGAGQAAPVAAAEVPRLLVGPADVGSATGANGIIAILIGL